MKWFATLAVFMALLCGLRAAAPDDRYVDIYNEILQGDVLLQNGNSKGAAEKYSHAQTSLLQLQKDRPDWNTGVVSYRLDYLADKLGSLAPAAATKAAPAPVSNATPTTQAGLEEQVRNLTSANDELEKELKEALSVQPAAVDPRELEKAGQEIVELKKERDLLKVDLENEKTARAQSENLRISTDEAKAAEVDNARLKLEARKLEKKLAAANDQISALKSNRAATPKSSDKQLKEELDATTKSLADAEAKTDEQMLAMREMENKLKQSEQQRNELAAKLAAVNPAATAPSTSDTGGLVQQVVQLRARLAVLEAAPVPYTTEELALLKQTPNQPLAPPVALVKPSGPVHSMKDLPPGAGPLMADAQRAMMERDYERAIQKYTDVLAQDENNVYVLVHLANSQFVGGHLDDCEKTVQRALALDPQDPGTLYLLGILRYRQEKLDDALDALSRSAQMNPTNAGTQNYLGCVLCDKGQRPAAETALRKALRLDPDYADAHYNLAFVYAMEKPPSLGLARWHYKKAVDLGHVKNDSLEKTIGEDK